MSRRKRNRKTQIRIEQLEKRELLAADLGGMRHNHAEPLDVNADTFVSPMDVLSVVNELNARSAGRTPQIPEGQQRFFDVNDDGAVSPVDALSVVNGVNRRARDAADRDRRGSDEPRDNPPQDNSPPETNAEFASIDGTGNNLEHPAWGSAGVPFERWVGADYADDTSEPAGDDRISAREVSNIVNATTGDVENADGLSDLTWLFGQFIDHDITLTEGGTDEAFDIEVPTSDPFFDPFGTGEATIDLERSGYSEDGDYREQSNQISAFIDGSVIYGSDQERADALRLFEGGLLKTSVGDLLPFNEAGLDNAGGTSDSLFLAGDIRANENAALTAMHTVWVREHNRVAQRIARDNPSLNDEEIYQLARQFVSAELQAITYNEFLPALLGEEAVGEYAGYDSSVNPNLSNVFSTAAYRFGHTMLSSELLRLNADGSVAEEGNLSLQDAFFNVSALTDHGIDSLLLGASVNTAQEVDTELVDDVRNFLFGPPGSGGFDLAALNIQRGRDHGIGDYNQVRLDMGLAAVTDFSEISSDPDVQARLEDAYGSVDSVDAWVGMLAEDHVEGSTLGVTAGAIIAEQFRAIRDGDRFFYENVFSGRQLRDLNNTTLASVIERNTDVDFARDQNVFYAQDVALEQLSRPRRGDMEALASNQAAMATPPINSPGAMQDQALADLEKERQDGSV